MMPGKTYLLFKFQELLYSSGALPRMQASRWSYTLSAAFKRPEVCTETRLTRIAKTKIATVSVSRGGN